MTVENISPDSIHTLTPVELRQQRFLGVLSEIDTYQDLLHRWTTEDVNLYLRQLNSHSAEDTIRRSALLTPSGIGIAYHERYELSQFERVVDTHLGTGIFRSKLQAGQLDDVRDFVVPEGDRLHKVQPYREVHPLAMRAEVEFLQQIAEKLGYSSSCLAFFLAKPNLWRDFRETTRPLQDIYEILRGGNLIRKSKEEHIDYPLNLPENIYRELVQAERFFEEYGDRDNYTIKPSVILQRNGLIYE